MSDARLLEIAHRLDTLNDRMAVLLDAWVTPESEAEMQDIEKEYAKFMTDKTGRSVTSNTATFS